MKALVVGAGAIGQVFGAALAAGGAEVSVLVRPGHRFPPSGCFEVTRLRRLGGRRTTRFVPRAVFTSLHAAGRDAVDQVWLCVPSTELDPGWLSALAAATGAATLVVLPAGVDTARSCGLPEARTVVGLITLMSRLEPWGASYWRPPLAAAVFSGPPARRAEVVRALRRGGCPVISGDASAAGAFGSALLIPHVVALESAGWSYAAFTAGPALASSLAASKEAGAAAAAHLGRRRPWVHALAQGWLVRGLLWLARRVLPFDLEAFFRQHFTKVRRQSEAQLLEYIALAERAGQPAPALRRLVAEVFGAP